MGTFGIAAARAQSQRPPTPARQILNGIFYVLRSRCQWRFLPKEFGPWETVYGRFRDECLNREQRRDLGEFDLRASFLDGKGGWPPFGSRLTGLLCNEKCVPMNGDWAARNLQTIRTLMERAAVYRRALAPIMITVGCLGLAAAALGWKLDVTQPRPFILYWLAVAALAGIVAFLLVRRQAIRAGEPIWSPPARRVVQAALPPLVAGLWISLVLAWMVPAIPKEPAGAGNIIGLLWLPLGWVVLYGCALHAAGFFLPRGIRMLGWTFVITGGLLFAALAIPDLPPGPMAHGLMGFFFGLLHQAYGVYLYLTEQKESAE